MAKKKKGKKKLAPMRAKFVQEYLIDLDANAAAIRAGYSEKTAYSQGSRLLKDKLVKAAIEEAMAKREERVQIDQDFVITTIVDMIKKCRGGDEAEEFNPNAVLKATEQLGKHLGMFVTKHEHTGRDGNPIEVETVSSVIRRIWDENEEAKKVDE